MRCQRHRLSAPPTPPTPPPPVSLRLRGAGKKRKTATMIDNDSQRSLGKNENTVATFSPPFVTLGVGLFPPRGSLPSCSSAVVVVVVPDLNVMAPRGQLPPFQPCVFYSIILSAQVKSFWTCLFIPWRSFKRVKSLLFSPEKKLKKRRKLLLLIFILFYSYFLVERREKAK
jgi:hypothetical protein